MAVWTASTASARDRVERWILTSLALLRVAQYAAPLPVVATHMVADWDTRGGFVAGAYLLGAAWSAGMFVVTLHNGGHAISSRVATSDVLVICVLQTSMPLVLGADRLAWQNWTYGPAIGASFVVILYGPQRLAWPLAFLPIVSWGTIPVVGWATSTPVDLSDVIAWSVGMLLFAGLGAHIARVLRCLARDVDDARAAESAAVEREAALRAAFDERGKHWRGLHDTALTTLEMIAGGALDVAAEEVRLRCRQDANYLRGLMMGDDSTGSTNLMGVLSDVLRDRSALGLVVHPQFDNLPAAVPGGVVEAFQVAVREVLNNVAKHAEVAEAWLTVVGTAEGGLQVTVVVRGVGFDSETTTTRGLTRSVRHPMEAVGGQAFFASDHGHGTMVELSWSP